jgi:uncharacterized membrane protein HdeD (DUF308 family)
MTVRHSVVMSMIMLFGGAVTMFNYTTSHMTFLLVIGAGMALMGLASFMANYLEVDGQSVIVKNPLGIAVRRYTADSPATMYVDGSVLFLMVNGELKKVSGKLIANPADWQALAARYPKLA